MENQASINKLLEYFEKRVSLSEADKALIASLYKPVKFKKKDYLFQQGEICKYQGFVTKGTFRTYYTDNKALEHVLYFAFEDWWVGDIASFYDHEPSGLNVQALQDSELLLLNHADSEKLFNAVPALEKVFRVIIQRHLTVLQKRFLMTVSANAEERFLELLERCPSIEQLVPQHQIASYLGILPESLSRMKKQIAKREKGL
ncbi:MAG: Crp/Fnr family transcriptional regulator [Bacteroidota bacterium]